MTYRDEQPFTSSDARFGEPPYGGSPNRGRPWPTMTPASFEFLAHRLRVRVLRVLWILVFLALVFVPLALAPSAAGSRRPWSEGGIWVELCLTTGLLGLSTLAATIVLPSRVKSITMAFGIEGVLRSHRWLAVATTVIVGAHLTFILIDNPRSILLISPGPTGVPRARAGFLAFAAMILLCVLAFRRRKMGTRYDVWRWVHAMMGIGALAGSYLHVIWLNHLMRDAAERTVFLVVLVGVGAVMINRWIRRPLVSWRQAYVIEQVRIENDIVSTLVLVPAHRRQPRLSFRPGQFAWIRLDSPFGPLQSNPFSIASGIDNPDALEFTIRNVGDFTGSIKNLEPGRKVFVDGPYGSFSDDHIGAPSLLLIGAGVGVTPMMSILRSHAFRGDLRRHILLFAVRNPSELMFRYELDLLGTELDLDVIEVVSKPPPSWRGVSGRVDADLLESVLEEFGPGLPHVFICGPPQMMEDTTRTLVELGVPPQNVHTEQFAMV
ncbi:MAG: Integrase [Actinomycetota bacterium]|nr:Integrase [Actinomycetota bacterium]